jgi:molybdenum cofactor guanylyltransferase
LPLTAAETIGLVLAGGRSSRFDGQDKAFISLAGEPLLAHVIRRLTPQVNRLVINSSVATERFQQYCLDVIPDRLPGFLGPLAGIHAGLIAWPEANVVSVAVDLPFLPDNLVVRLKRSWNGQRCRYVDTGRGHALAILWPPGLADQVETFLLQGHRSLGEWLARHGEPVSFASDDPTLWVNVNTPEDLLLAERQLTRAP